jgi:hypothetical protein
MVARYSDQFGHGKCNAIVTLSFPGCAGRSGRNFRILGVSIFGSLQRYELEKIRSPWLRGSMHFRSLDCDGADVEPR